MIRIYEIECEGERVLCNDNKVKIARPVRCFWCSDNERPVAAHVRLYRETKQQQQQQQEIRSEYISIDKLLL